MLISRVTFTLNLMHVLSLDASTADTANVAAMRARRGTGAHTVHIMAGGHGRRLSMHLPASMHHPVHGHRMRLPTGRLLGQARVMRSGPRIEVNFAQGS